eukprot:Rmarinus@m.25026
MGELDDLDRAVDFDGYSHGRISKRSSPDPDSPVAGIRKLLTEDGVVDFHSYSYADPSTPTSTPKRAKVKKRPDTDRAGPTAVGPLFPYTEMKGKIASVRRKAMYLVAAVWRPLVVVVLSGVAVRSVTTALAHEKMALPLFLLSWPAFAIAVLGSFISRQAGETADSLQRLVALCYSVLVGLACLTAVMESSQLLSELPSDAPLPPLAEQLITFIQTHGGDDDASAAQLGETFSGAGDSAGLTDDNRRHVGERFIDVLVDILEADWMRDVTVSSIQQAWPVFLRLVRQPAWVYMLVRFFAMFLVGCTYAALIALGGTRWHHNIKSPYTFAWLAFQVFLCWVEAMIIVSLQGIRRGVGSLCSRAVVSLSASWEMYPLVPRILSMNVLRSMVLERTCARAETYGEYARARRELDVLAGGHRWVRTEASKYIDAEMLTSTMEHLQAEREAAEKSNCGSELLRKLRSVFVRNYANICDPHLYGFPSFGTKRIVYRFLESVTSHLDFVQDTNFRDVTIQQKFHFLREVSHSMGRTALCLSGGGSLGMIHLGLVQQLVRDNLLPDIISGTSGGAIAAALVGSKTDHELLYCITPDLPNSCPGRFFDPPLDMAIRLIREGHIIDPEAFQTKLSYYFGDVTLAEAFKRTGRAINITVAGEQLGCPPILNYITAPEVLLSSAVTASCALPGLMTPRTLLAKDSDGKIVPFHAPGIAFVDGGLESDIPMEQLSSQFHATHFIVSQVNPSVVPFLSEAVVGGRIAPLDFLAHALMRRAVQRVRRVARIESTPLSPASIFMKQSVLGRGTDVTCWPELQPFDVARALLHPFENDMTNFFKQGERSVYPRIERIRVQTTLERRLRECVRVVGAQYHQQSALSFGFASS